MGYNLFLDDERQPANVTWVELPNVQWRIVRTFKDFVGMITKEGLPDIVSFDHDLAGEHYNEFHRAISENDEIRYNKLREKTGYDAAKWLVGYCLERNLDLPECYIHTWNNIGRDNIKGILDTYKKFRSKK